MISRSKSHLSAMLARLKRIWAELDYANQRMFEIRTSEYFMKDASAQEPRSRVKRRTAVPPTKPTRTKPA